MTKVYELNVNVNRLVAILLKIVAKALKIIEKEFPNLRTKQRNNAAIRASVLISRVIMYLVILSNLNILDITNKEGQEPDEENEIPVFHGNATPQEISGLIQVALEKEKKENAIVEKKMYEMALSWANTTSKLKRWFIMKRFVVWYFFNSPAWKVDVRAYLLAWLLFLVNLGGAICWIVLCLQKLTQSHQ